MGAPSGGRWDSHSSSNKISAESRPTGQGPGRKPPPSPLTEMKDLNPPEAEAPLAQRPDSASLAPQPIPVGPPPSLQPGSSGSIWPLPMLGVAQLVVPRLPGLCMGCSRASHTYEAGLWAPRHCNSSLNRGAGNYSKCSNAPPHPLVHYSMLGLRHSDTAQAPSKGIVFPPFMASFRYG